MLIERIDHIQLAMPKGLEDEARGFYSGLLGIPEVTKPAKLAARGGAWFEEGDHRVYAEDPFGNRLEFLESRTKRSLVAWSFSLELISKIGNPINR